jgi:PAS domain S-box-containing protein
MPDLDRLSALTLDSIDRAIHVVDTDLRIRIFNRAFERWCQELGLKLGNVIGKNVFDVFPFLPEEVREECRQILQKGEPLITEEENVIGSARVFTETHKLPVLEEGKITHIITIVTDITDRKLAQEAVREGQERYERLFATVSDAIIVFEAETLRFVDVNQAALDLYGYSRAEFLELALWDITSEPEKSEASILDTFKGKRIRIPLRYHTKKERFPGAFSRQIARE